MAPYMHIVVASSLPSLSDLMITMMGRSPKASDCIWRIQLSGRKVSSIRCQGTADVETRLVLMSSRSHSVQETISSRPWTNRVSQVRECSSDGSHVENGLLMLALTHLGTEELRR